MFRDGLTAEAIAAGKGHGTLVMILQGQMMEIPSPTTSPLRDQLTAATPRRDQLIAPTPHRDQRIAANPHQQRQDPSTAPSEQAQPIVRAPNAAAPSRKACLLLLIKKYLKRYS